MSGYTEAHDRLQAILLRKHISIHTKAFGIILMLLCCNLDVRRRRNFYAKFGKGNFKISDISKEEAEAFKITLSQLIDDPDVFFLPDDHNPMESIKSFNRFYFSFSLEKFIDRLIPAFEKFLNNLDNATLTPLRLMSKDDNKFLTSLAKEDLHIKLDLLIERYQTKGYPVWVFQNTKKMIDFHEHELGTIHDACTILNDLKSSFPCVLWDKDFNELQADLYKRYSYLEPIVHSLEQKKPTHWYQRFFNRKAPDTYVGFLRSHTKPH